MEASKGNWFSAFAKRPFVRNVTTVATGTAIAQLIALLFTPLVTRLYQPEAFGAQGVFLSVTAILTPLAALAYPIAIVLPVRDEDARLIARLSLLICVATTSLVGVALLLFSQPIITLFKLESISSLLVLLPVVVLAQGFLQIYQQWLFRKRRYSITANVAVLNALFVNGAKSAFGLVQPVASTLVVIATAGVGLYAAMLRSGAKDLRIATKSFVRTDIAAMLRLAGNYSDFPKYRAPQNLLNASTQGLPIVLLALLFDASAAGFYALAMTVLLAPVSLIGASIGSVLYPQLTEISNNGKEIGFVVFRITGALFAISVIPFGVIMVYGPSLFTIAFGTEWTTAGEFARWLAVWVMIAFANAPSVQSIPVIGAQKFHLYFGAFTAVLRLLSLFVGYTLSGNAVSTLIVYSVTGAGINLTLIVLVQKKIQRFDRRNVMTTQPGDSTR